MAFSVHAAVPGDSPYWPFFKDVQKGRWTMNYDGALAQARADGSPVLLAFAGTMWCPYCHAMEQNVLTQPAWIDRVKDAYLVLLDFPRREEGIDTLLKDAGYLSAVGATAAEGAAVLTRNWTLHAQYTVPGGARVGFPTVVVLDSAGVVLGRFSDNDENALPLVLGKLDELLAGQTGGEADSFASGAIWLTAPLAGATAVTNNALGVADSEDWYVFTPHAASGAAAWTFSVTGTVDTAVTLALYKNPAEPPVGTVKGRLNERPLIACYPAVFDTPHYLRVTAGALTGVVDYELHYQTLPTNGWGAVAETLPGGVSAPRTSGSVQVGVRIRRFGAAGAVAARVVTSAVNGAGAQAGVHFTQSAEVFTLAAGETERDYSFTVPVLNPQPSVWRGDKVFKVVVEPLSNCVAAAAQTLVTLTETESRHAGELAFAGYGAPMQTFNPSRAFAFESQEGATATVWVTRRGGTDGAVTGTVIYVRDDYPIRKAVVWAAGESGARQVPLYMPGQVSPPQVRTLAVVLTGDPAAPLASPQAGQVTVAVGPGGLPAFADGTAAFTLAARVAGQSVEFPVRSRTDGTFTAELAAGRLPGGMKLSVAGSSLRLTGMPTAAGVYPFTVALRLKAGRDTFAGERRAFTANVLPVGEVVDFEPAGIYDGLLTEAGGTVCGSFSLTVRPRGNGMTVKIKTLTGQYSLTANGWRSADAGDGLHLTAETRRGLAVDFRVFAEGLLTGQVTLENGAVVEAAGGARPAATDALRAAYAGYYTAALPAEEVEPLDADCANVPRGSGYLTLTVDAKLNARYSGQLADGTGYSGSARCLPAEALAAGALTAGAEGVCVPVVVPLYGRRGSVTALVVIQPGGDAARADDNRLAVSGSRWQYPGKGRGAWADGFGAGLDGGYGAYYGTARPAETYAGGALRLPRPWDALEPVGVVAVGANGRGALTAEKENVPGARLTVVARTGLFKGSYSADGAASGERRVNFTGVLLPAFGRGEGYSLLKDPEWWPAYRLRRSYGVELDAAALDAGP
jgi:hypothetical protein